MPFVYQQGVWSCVDCPPPHAPWVRTSEGRDRSRYPRKNGDRSVLRKQLGNTGWSAKAAAGASPGSAEPPGPARDSPPQPGAPPPTRSLKRRPFQQGPRTGCSHPLPQAPREGSTVGRTAPAATRLLLGAKPVSSSYGPDSKPCREPETFRLPGCRSRRPSVCTEGTEWQQEVFIANQKARGLPPGGGRFRDGAEWARLLRALWPQQARLGAPPRTSWGAQGPAACRHARPQVWRQHASLQTTVPESFSASPKTPQAQPGTEHSQFVLVSCSQNEV